jgi:dTDP-4-dehydrorhamnose reductase
MYPLCTDNVSGLVSQDVELLSKLTGKIFLITGGGGMLGQAFKIQIERNIPGAVIYCLDKNDLDVRRKKSFSRIDKLKPDFVIHCAALVNADYCEVYPAEAKESILGGTQNVVEFSKRCNAKLLYPQSFLIYGESDAPIDENTEPCPLSVYGKFKLEAENFILDRSPHSLIIRMGGFFGGELLDKNFVGKIIPHLAGLIQQGKPSIDIGNRVWQPTYTNDLAANCLLLLASDSSGKYCMASEGAASFYGLTKKIAGISAIAGKIDINCVDASIFTAKEKARRPMSAIMKNQRLNTDGLNRQRNWEESLAEYMNQSFFIEQYK